MKARTSSAIWLSRFSVVGYASDPIAQPDGDSMANPKQQWLQAFTGGFVATLLFHQGVLALFWLGGLIPAFPWNMTPVPP